VSGSASTERLEPLTFRVMAMMGLLEDGSARCAFFLE
jgi:hypothetical protein